jgi:hypothetical protein
MYFSNGEEATVNFIAEVARLAKVHGQRLRIDVDGAGNLRIKRGEGVWSAPISSTPDPYRDKSGCNHNCDIDTVRHGDEKHFLDCPVWKRMLETAWNQ